MNIQTLSQKLISQPDTGLNSVQCTQLAADAIHFFRTPDAKQEPFLGRHKHNQKVPRTVIRAHDCCMYLLKTKGGASLLGEGRFAKVSRVVVIRKNGSVELAKAKTVYRSLDTAMSECITRYLCHSSFVDPAPYYSLRYWSEKSKKEKHLMISEMLAFDTASTEMRTLKPLQILSIIADVALGLMELHRNRRVHNDIKPDNILVRKVNSLYQGVLSDLGLVKVANYKGKTAIGSARWNPPETFDDPKCSYAKDIWAFGITAFQLLKTKKDLKDRGIPKFLRNIESKSMYKSDFFLFLSFIDQSSVRKSLFKKGWCGLEDCGGVDRIIRGCLSVQPKDRPKASTLAMQLSAEVIRLSVRDLIFSEAASFPAL